MPWKESSPMSERKAFVREALAGESSMSALCRAFGVSRKTGYKWLARYREEGLAGQSERSRRPQRSPKQTPPEVERVVVEARERHPAWGGRKLKRWLEPSFAQAIYAADAAMANVTGFLPYGLRQWRA